MAQSAGLNNAFKLRDSIVAVTEPRFGAKGDGSTNDRAAFVAAATAANGAKIVVPRASSSYNMGSALAFAETDRLYFAQGASFSGTAPTGGDREWEMARSTATAGSKMKIEHLRELNTNTGTSGVPAEDEGGIWTPKTHAYSVVAREFVLGDGAASAPCIAFMSRAYNSGSVADVVAHLPTAVAGASNAAVYAINAIARSISGITTPKLVGMEVDLAPASGVTPGSGSGILFLNVFNSACSGPAIQIGGVTSGTVANGVIVSTGIAVAGTCFGTGSVNCDSFWTTSNGTFNTSAGIMGNTHRIRFSGTASAHAFIYTDSSNNLRIVNASSATIFRNNADNASNITIDDGGNIDTIGVYKKSGSQVVGARSTGWTNQTAVASKADLGAAPTVNALAAFCSALDVMLKAHGLTGT